MPLSGESVIWIVLENFFATDTPQFVCFSCFGVLCGAEVFRPQAVPLGTLPKGVVSISAKAKSETQLWMSLCGRPGVNNTSEIALCAD